MTTFFIVTSIVIFTYNDDYYSERLAFFDEVFFKVVEYAYDLYKSNKHIFELCKYFFSVSSSPEIIFFLLVIYWFYWLML